MRIQVGGHRLVRLGAPPQQAGIDPSGDDRLSYYVNTGMFDGAKSAPLLPILGPRRRRGVMEGMCSGSSFVVLPGRSC